MFRWSDFLDVAAELAGRIGDEAAERTAIGRAYDAAFGAARDDLIRTGSPIPKMGPQPTTARVANISKKWVGHLRGQCRAAGGSG